MSRAFLLRPATLPRSSALAWLLAATLTGATVPAAARTTDVAPALLDREDFEAAAAARTPRAGRSYPYIRCAALYRALRVMARPADGPAMPALARPTAAERGLIDEAARARAEQTDLPRAAAGPMAETDIDALSALYASRFDTLASRDPARWWNDALIETDLRACGLLLESIGHGVSAPEPEAGPDKRAAPNR